MGEFWKAAISDKGYSSSKDYSICKLVSLSQKLKYAKNMRKTIPREHYSCSVKKTAQKHNKYSSNEVTLKVCNLSQSLSPMQKL